MDISFYTICYEADWRSILIEGRLSKLIKSCNHNFRYKNLIINNVQNRILVEYYAQKAIEANIIDNYFFSSDLYDEVLTYFKIKRRSFMLDGYDGFFYSIAPLTSIYLCNTEFIMFFTGDCIIKNESNSRWIIDAMEMMNKNKDIFVANPLWDYDKGECKRQSFAEDENWRYGFGFTDQCFLIKTLNIKQPIFGYYHVSSESYPIYGGNLFERRVNSYMRVHNKIRITSKCAIYEHEKLVDEDYNPIVKKSGWLKKRALFFFSIKRRVRKKFFAFFQKKHV